MTSFKWLVGAVLILIGVLFEPIGWLRFPIGDGQMSLYPAGFFILAGLLFLYRNYRAQKNS